MKFELVIFFALLYIMLLFWIAWWGDKRAKSGRSVVTNPYIYAISLAIYCTAWTFFGSVGRASSTGYGFLPVYLGPTLLMPIWLLVLRKIIVISKHQRITSVADFLSARYGKSIKVGILVTLVMLLSSIPYISLQIKAIALGIKALSDYMPHAYAFRPSSVHTAFWVTVILGTFSILYGTRQLDPNERHEGLVASIAFESVVKLVAFLAVGVFVTFGLFEGFGDIFQKASLSPAIAKLFLVGNPIDSSNWFWISALSMTAVVLLPRQFHISVVESTNEDFLGTAAWMFPLYMLLINIFVLPIAVAGLLYFGTDTGGDTFVLTLPLQNGAYFLALLVFIGGFSAAFSMVIVETVALSIMLCNNLALPLIWRFDFKDVAPNSNFAGKLLIVRRLSIGLVLGLSLLYFKYVAYRYALVSLGLISFAAVAQFMPALIGGLYWRRANKKGALAGIMVGFFIWVFTLAVPTLFEANILNHDILTHGYFGQLWLHPYALFGLKGMSTIAHGAFWSLFLNSVVFVLVSSYTKQGNLEYAQADVFVDIYKYQKTPEYYDVMRREAHPNDLISLLQRFLGNERSCILIRQFENEKNIKVSELSRAKEDLISYVETHLGGVFGVASARIVVGSITKTSPIALEEMFEILEQTREAILHSHELENKSRELEKTSMQLLEANEQLKVLEKLKTEFVTSVTHELRTPITSIRSFSKILLDNPELSTAQVNKFLQIIVQETERISRLVNQVLDLEKLQTNNIDLVLKPLELNDLVEKAWLTLQPTMMEKKIEHTFISHSSAVWINADEDRFIQIVVNLLSNAIKFCDKVAGKIEVKITISPQNAFITVSDNGRGISPEQHKIIFERFTQLNDEYANKPGGTGVGLHIAQQLAVMHGGDISIENSIKQGASFKIRLPLLATP